MKQTLKISIVRGGCRFATPLYLGGEYALAFEGERADEAKTLLVTRPQKDRDGNLIALAKSEAADDGGVSLFLNRQALVDWFADCGAEDVDAAVDAHVYVFDADAVVIADSDVAIEYRPVDFAISDKEFEKWSDHEDRIEVLEDASRSHDAAIADHEKDIAALAKQDKADLETSAEDAKAKADAALLSAKEYADAIRKDLAQMQYVKCADESTEGRSVYHQVTIVKNSLGQPVLSVDPNPRSIEGGDPDIGRYVYLDTAQTITGKKTLVGGVIVNDEASFTGDLTSSGTTKLTGTATAITCDSDDDSANIATTAHVTKKVDTKIAASMTELKSADNSWTGKNTWSGSGTFSKKVTANGGLATTDATLSGSLVVTRSVSVPTVAASDWKTSGTNAANISTLATMLAGFQRWHYFGQGSTDTATTKTFNDLIPNAKYKVWWFSQVNYAAAYDLTTYYYDSASTTQSRSVGFTVNSIKIADSVTVSDSDNYGYVITSGAGACKIGFLIGNVRIRAVWCQLTFAGFSD